MADAQVKFKRRIVSYLYGCKLNIWIKVADFLKLLSKDDDIDSNLLDVPKKLRKDDESKD